MPPPACVKLPATDSVLPAPTVRLSFVNTTVDPHAPQVTVTVVNDRPTAVSGTLALAAESGARFAAR